MSDITKQSLTELVENIKNKKLSSTDVTKAFIERSDNSKELNAYITEDFTSALDKAKKFDQKPNFDLKLPGIPMAVKDLFCTKDVKTTAGSKILNNFVPTYESTVTENIWKEGAILLGKLNCDEFAMGSSNETSFFGNVQNPIDKDLVPGGSSGGSASAVAGQLTPITIGTDTGGSIRQPASFTGTVGLKPTYGQTRQSHWGGLNHHLPATSPLWEIGLQKSSVQPALIQQNGCGYRVIRILLISHPGAFGLLMKNRQNFGQKVLNFSRQETGQINQSWKSQSLRRERLQ